MKRTSVLFFILIVCSFSSKAQKRDSSIYTYSGQLVNLQEHRFRSTFLGNLQGMEKESYQGLDIFGDYIVSCQNTGIATIYKMDSKQFIRLQGPFHLASYHHNNHSNVASFGTTFFAPNDPLPLLYISQCHREPINGLKDVLYVERFAKDLKSSTLVQTIYFKDIHHLFGYALQWVIDRDNGYLYGYGNTIDNENPLNRHRIVKFRIPTLDESTDGLVTLNDNDILENYLIEDTYARPFNPIGQGLCIKNGCLYMPTGIGNKKSPSILYIWNLETRHMQNIVDLTKATTTELEDCAVYQGDLIVQAQKGLFRLSF